MLSPFPRRSAFTLVELSIVLVILCLLVGGVLSGQSLIRASQLRAVTTEYTNYNIALTGFRDKYLAVPGDMPNASSYWGLASACGGSDTTTSVCDGDGDMEVAVTAANGTREFLMFWRELANAGLIEGSYTGMVNGGGATQTNTPGVNIPRSKLGNAGWGAASAYNGDWGSNSDGYMAPFPTVTGLLLFFGAPDTNSGDYFIPTQPIIKAEEAFNIDTKMDDGNPGTGIVTGNSMSSGSCQTADNSAYLLSNPSIACNMVFQLSN